MALQIEDNVNLSDPRDTTVASTPLTQSPPQTTIEDLPNELLSRITTETTRQCFGEADRRISDLVSLSQTNKRFSAIARDVLYTSFSMKTGDPVLFLCTLMKTDLGEKVKCIFWKDEDDCSVSSLDDQISRIPQYSRLRNNLRAVASAAGSTSSDCIFGSRTLLTAIMMYTPALKRLEVRDHLGDIGASNELLYTVLCASYNFQHLQNVTIDARALYAPDIARLMKLPAICRLVISNLQMKPLATRQLVAFDGGRIPIPQQFIASRFGINREDDDFSKWPVGIAESSIKHLELNESLLTPKELAGIISSCRELSSFSYVDYQMAIDSWYLTILNPMVSQALQQHANSLGDLKIYSSLP